MYMELQCTNIPVLLNFKHWLFWIEVCLKGTYNYQYSLNDTGLQNLLGFFFFHYYLKITTQLFTYRLLTM